MSNRLAKEKSPYLLQHAENPVDWYPWGNEAFEAALKAQKPIFLSIGYATCHWCHVMAHEAFEHPEIAQLLNDTFINIKVDREELPHVDALYMDFAQALMSSGGGWPLNVILTPDLKPFFAITYLPPKTSKGLLGLDDFIRNIQMIWGSEERQQLIEQADKVLKFFEQASRVSGDQIPAANVIPSAAKVMYALEDPLYGGIKGAPKFPLGYQTEFLLQVATSEKEERALFCADLTLEGMRKGGIYDHIGGGFCRYATDEKWQIPHFEKMLYDNAILARTYLQAWKLTRKQEFRRVCEETLNYVLREMTDPQGGFYSAQDADSEGHEGVFYTWTPNEIRQEFSLVEAEAFCSYYGVTESGNFEGGRSILFIETPSDEMEDKLTETRTHLFKVREKRVHPFKDDKILCSWNALMIDALAQAGAALQRPRFLEAASEAAGFIKAHLWKEGRLLRRFREGEARFSGGLEDYAFLIKALLSLFEVGRGSAWLQWAIELTQVLEKEFKAPGGAFYATSERETVLLRRCDFYDGAEPSGNGVHSENLLRLYQITGEQTYLTQAEEIFKAAKEHIESHPLGACYHLLALQRYYDLKSSQLVICLDDKQQFKQELFQAINAHFNPHTEIIWKLESDSLLTTLLPFVKDKGLVNGKTTLHLCRKNRCEAPVSDLEQMLKLIESL